MDNKSYNRFKWQVLLSTENNTWRDVDGAISTKLEDLAVNSDLKFTFSQWSYTAKKITIDKCIQTNDSTNKQRFLRRILLLSSLPNGKIYFQYGFYTKYQMNTISANFKNKNTKQDDLEIKSDPMVANMFYKGYLKEFQFYMAIPTAIIDLCQSFYGIPIVYNKYPLSNSIAPKLIFGDHYFEKYRLDNMKRKRFGGQSAVLGHYDRTYGYGITTGFKLNIYDVGFEKWSELILQEFEVLRHHLFNNGDIIIPIPSYNELRSKTHLYYHNKTKEQVINHTLGTGNAPLPFHFRQFIQQQIEDLKQYASDTFTVEMQLFQ